MSNQHFSIATHAHTIYEIHIVRVIKCHGWIKIVMNFKAVNWSNYNIKILVTKTWIAISIPRSCTIKCAIHTDLWLFAVVGSAEHLSHNICQVLQIMCHFTCLVAMGGSLHSSHKNHLAVRCVRYSIRNQQQISFSIPHMMMYKELHQKIMGL